MASVGVRAPHDVDRDLGELLQQLRVVQTGGQLFFAFLFSVAFLPFFTTASEGQRALYATALVLVVAAIAVLVSPVAVHRAVFGRRARASLLIYSHYSTIVGMVLLALGILLGISLISTVVFPASPWWLIGCCGAVVTTSWLVVPLTARARWRSDLSEAAGGRAI